MSVTVLIRRTTPTHIDGQKDEYPNASEFEVRDGHLYIQRAQAAYTEDIAAYGPGQWIDVYVGDERK